MGIRGSSADFYQNYKSRYSWPSMKFTRSGPKLTLGHIEDLPFELADEHAAFLLWKNGSTPATPWFTRKGETLKIRYFYGLGSDHDLCEAMLKHRYILPRFSVPIARVESNDHDVCLLLSFPFDGRQAFTKPTKGREKKVWFHWIFEDHLPEDNKLDDLVLASHSIQALVTALKPDAPKNCRMFEGCDDSSGDWD